MMHSLYQRKEMFSSPRFQPAAGAAVGKKGIALADNRPQSIAQRKLVNADPSTTAPLPVQRKINSTGLPDQLKSGIENLSGHSMDDVKVHYNSSQPAQLNAHAYAQGTNIHVGPGQEKHLAHEAWHVVQQKQGRVKTTKQLKGKTNVNDDASLEKEADIMGAKALQAKSYGREILLNSTASGTTVQRKVGFEFESVGDSKWKFQGKNDMADNWQGISNTKEILLNTPNGLAGASADNGNVEFVTRPLSDWEEAASTIAELENMVAALKTGTGPAGITNLAGHENDYAKSKSKFNHNRVNSFNSDIRARPQATIGVSMMNIDDLFHSLLNMRAGKGPGGEDNAFELDPAIGSATTTYQMNVSLVQSTEFLKQAAALSGINWDNLSETQKTETSGLLTVILKTLWDAFSNSGPGLTDPKYAFPLMPRTDFRSMLDTLKDQSKELIIKLWTDGSLPRTINAVYPLDKPVFPGKYKGTDNKRHSGPSKEDWLNSIFTGAGPKDLLSPPPFYPAHATTPRPEGIGAYGADGKLSLFELRDAGSMGNLPVDKWIDLVMSVCRLVAEVEGDSKFNPPVI